MGWDQTTRKTFLRDSTCEITGARTVERCEIKKDQTIVIAVNYFNDNGMYETVQDLPARVFYYEDTKQPKSEMWYINGKRVRELKPAIVYYDKDGNITEEIYYRNGDIVDVPDDWNEMDDETKQFTWNLL